LLLLLGASANAPVVSVGQEQPTSIFKKDTPPSAPAAPAPGGAQATVNPPAAAPAPPPKTIDELNAAEVLRLVRYSYTLYDRDFHGQLRVGLRTKIPFTLSLQPNYIRFKFDDPIQIIHLNTEGEQFFLKEVVAGSDAEVPPERYAQNIRDTDVTYDDLSMRFLYWPDARIIRDTDVLKGRATWLIRARNPDGLGTYSTVDIWIDKGSGGLMKMLGYNAQGRPIRKFEVLHGKKIDDIWMVDEMRVETLDPADGKRVSHTYMEILDSAKTIRAD
jgi:hypothetical protein